MYLVIHSHQGTTKIGAATDDLAIVSEEMNAPEYDGWTNGYITIETTDPGGSIEGAKAKKEREAGYKKQEEDRIKAEQALITPPPEEAKKGKAKEEGHQPEAHRSSR
jgi:hypothetical protein